MSPSLGAFLVHHILRSIQGVRAYMQQSRVYVGMVLILIFGEVLGLYGYGPPVSSRRQLYLQAHQVDRWSDFELKEQGLRRDRMVISTIAKG